MCILYVVIFCLIKERRLYVKQMKKHRWDGIQLLPHKEQLRVVIKSQSPTYSGSFQNHNLVSISNSLLMYRNRANQRIMCVKSALILSIPAQKCSGLCPPQHIQVKLWNTRGLPSTFCSAFRGSPSTLCGLLLPAELIYQTLTHTQPLKPSVTHCLFLISSLLSQGKYENPVPLLESHHYILHHIWSTQNCSSFLLHGELL